MKQITLAIAAAALLAGCGGETNITPTAGGGKAGCATRAYAEIGGPISLVDQTGTPRSEADFMGKIQPRVFRLHLLPRRLPDDAGKD